MIMKTKNLLICGEPVKVEIKVWIKIKQHD
jgi:hypothetical protein